MTFFFALAAALTVLAAAGVAFGLLRAPRAAGARAEELNAAVYREQIRELDEALAQGTISRDAHARARDAIRARLATEIAAQGGAGAAPGTPGWMPVAAVLFVCASGPVLYAALGTPAALQPAVVAAAPQDSAHALQGADMANRVERLARRLEKNPDDVDGWVMLARSHSAAGRFDAASAALGEATKRAPNDANLLADRADVAAMAAGRRFDGEPDALVARALQVDPKHRKALALAGTSAFARRDYAKAVAHWTRLREQLPPDSEAAARVDASLAQARTAMGGEGAPAKAAAITGTVSVTPELAGRISSGDTLFIYARAPEGSRVPVAVVRHRVDSWPVRFRLDDSHSMSPKLRLSALTRVALEARVSRSGAATPSQGDLRAATRAVAVGAEGIPLVIDAVVQ
jgi:cytochrome c-type biogenesis protein CcmH